MEKAVKKKKKKKEICYSAQRKCEYRELTEGMCSKRTDEAVICRFTDGTDKGRTVLKERGGKKRVEMYFPSVQRCKNGLGLAHGSSSLHTSHEHIMHTITSSLWKSEWLKVQ